MPVDRDRKRERVEPSTAADLTRHLTHVALDLLSGGVALGLVVAPHQIRDHALVTRLVGARAAVPILVANLHASLHALAVQKQLALLLTEVLPRQILGNLVELADRFDQPREVATTTTSPRLDRATRNGLLLVGDHESSIDLEHGAEAIAMRAGAVGRIEREIPGGELVERLAVARARQVLTEDDRLGITLLRDDLEFGDATREVERRLDRVGEPALDPFAQDETVDDNGDVVRLIALEFEFVLLVEIDELPVDDGSDEPLAGEVGKQSVVASLSALHDRSEDLESQPFLHRQDLVDDLLRCLAHQRFTRLGIVRDTDASEQEAQIVVDLGDGADRRPRVAACGLLVDRDRRGKPFDEIDIGLVHLPQELAGVGAQ